MLFAIVSASNTPKNLVNLTNTLRAIEVQYNCSFAMEVGDEGYIEYIFEDISTATKCMIVNLLNTSDVIYAIGE